MSREQEIAAAKKMGVEPKTEYRTPVICDMQDDRPLPVKVYPTGTALLEALKEKLREKECWWQVTHFVRTRYGETYAVEVRPKECGPTDLVIPAIANTELAALCAAINAME